MAIVALITSAEIRCSVQTAAKRAVKMLYFILTPPTTSSLVATFRKAAMNIAELNPDPIGPASIAIVTIQLLLASAATAVTPEIEMTKTTTSITQNATVSSHRSSRLRQPKKPAGNHSIATIPRVATIAKKMKTKKTTIVNLIKSLILHLLHQTVQAFTSTSATFLGIKLALVY